jgi:hypothetical protein
MNVKRILWGGVLAGLFLNVSEGVLNAVILMDEYQALMDRYGLSEASWAMAGYTLANFALGFAVAWLYAAIRPRFGAGARTGAIAGVALWVVSYAVPSVWFGAMGMALSAGSTVLAIVWGLVEMALAGTIAGWAYQEGVAAT